MRRNKGGKLKSGASLFTMLAVMAVMAGVFGYFVSSWFLDYYAAPKEKLNAINGDKIVKEEEINPDKLKEKASNSNATKKKAETESEKPTISQSINNQNLFVVQVGAFSKKSNAQGLVKNLKKQGFTAYITSEEPYRVQTGAFRTEKAAEELGSELKKSGFSVYIKH
ncbi:sporulation related protein [Halobacteroides halobius DSM 5150]|uniref:Sporulation related protein n=1 Tax=Halobacteroides halobius (strain ATCC 35273 / DSM 5150 / MD-1) TaxID=748449 RepID=L0KA90_HALHC|nr:SPOR domain-containing protein [Halobacteroides halobius]AGB41916.1 sporulation related protein [Halobacteroides halobius DSM 5150]